MTRSDGAGKPTPERSLLAGFEHLLEGVPSPFPKVDSINDWLQEEDEKRNREIAMIAAQVQAEKQEAKLREDRLAAIAEAAHLRAEKAEKRNHLMLLLAIAALIVAIAALVVSIAVA